jgi:hypothetical protein
MASPEDNEVDLAFPVILHRLLGERADDQVPSRDELVKEDER